MIEVDYDFYPLFRIGEKVIVDFACKGGLYLQSVHDQHGEEGEVEQDKAELELPFQAAQYKHEQQKEEEEKEKSLEEDEYFSLLFREEEEAIADIACGFQLQSAHGHQKRKQKKKRKKKKRLDAVQYTLLEENEVATIEELTCDDLDILMHEADNLMQHGTSITEEGEIVVSCHQLSPHSMQLLRIKEKGVEDFTSADCDFPLHEESSINDGQHQTNEEKQEEEQEEAITPGLQEKEASELQHPQATTPRHKEEEAAYPSMYNSFSSEFELTLNQFLLSLNVFISGDKLQERQLNLIEFCKLQPIAKFGEVHKKGARGDGVPWFIKVHPP